MNKLEVLFKKELEKEIDEKVHFVQIYERDNSGVVSITVVSGNTITEALEVSFVFENIHGFDGKGTIYTLQAIEKLYNKIVRENGDDFSSRFSL